MTHDEPIDDVDDEDGDEDDVDDEDGDAGSRLPPRRIIGRRRGPLSDTWGNSGP